MPKHSRQLIEYVFACTKLKQNSLDRESQVKVMFSLKWKDSKGGIGHWSFKEIQSVRGFSFLEM